MIIAKLYIAVVHQIFRQLGDNASTTLVGLPQRGPMRQDGLVTLQVTYSRGLVVRSRRTKKIGAVSAAKAALKTAQDMLILRPMAKSRIRLKVCNVQSGPSVSEEKITAIHRLQSYFRTYSRSYVMVTWSKVT